MQSMLPEITIEVATFYALFCHLHLRLLRITEVAFPIKKGNKSHKYTSV